jgi:hypothetical protein
MCAFQNPIPTYHRCFIRHSKVRNKNALTLWYSSHILNFILWHICSKLELRSQHRQPLLGNSSSNTLVARKQLRKHTTLSQLLLSNVIILQCRSCLERCFLSCPCWDNLWRQPVQVESRVNSSETAVTRARDWNETVASLRGRERGDRGSSTAGRRYQQA